MKRKYKEILENYPEFVSKETMCKICNISKRTAYFLLNTGLVPCESSEKQTRKYRIKVTDIIKYLIDCEINPVKYYTPSGWYKSCEVECVKSNYDFSSKSRASEFLTAVLANYPDVLSLAQVAEVVNFSTSTVADWCSSGMLPCFTVRNAFMVPKPFLYEFLMQAESRIIKIMVRKHKDALMKTSKR